MGEADVEKQLKLLKSQYDMYENSIKDTISVMKSKINRDGTKMFSKEDIDKHVELMRTAQADTVEQYLRLGGTEEELKAKTKGRKKSSSNASVTSMIAQMNQEDKEKKAEEEKYNFMTGTQTIQERLQKDLPTGTNIAFDRVPLPSHGECYASKMDKIPVSYLTAYDENMIASPGLYRDNKVLDFLLGEKIMNDEINPDEMLEGDREAIILWLRASGYGNEFPINVTDNDTGIEFESTVDLSTLNFKEFKLKGDSHGWFDYELPVSKDKIKFKFLTHNDNKQLDMLTVKEDKSLIKGKLEDIVEQLDSYIEDDEVLDNTGKIRTREAIRNIERWMNTYDSEDSPVYNHAVTNRMELSIMAINDITDRTYIHNYVRNMNVRDSSALRKYITSNEPGIDYNVKVQKPANLGGGSMNVFLQFDQFIFLNIAD